MNQKYPRGRLGLSPVRRTEWCSFRKRTMRRLRAIGNASGNYERYNRLAIFLQRRELFKQ